MAKLIRLFLRLLLLADCAIITIGSGALYAYLSLAHLEPPAQQVAPGLSIVSVMLFLGSGIFFGFLIDRWWPRRKQ